MKNPITYKELTLRNQGLLDKKTQEKIRKARILFIGCGLGSQIAVLAARTGFEKFILCDGDKVEFHNLNRQAFDISDVGKNKAKVLRKKILKINPKAKVVVYPKFVKTREETKFLIKNCDVIINMADPGEVIYFIDEEAKKQKKPVLFPLNFIFGAFVLVFTPKTKPLEKILKARILDGRLFEAMVMSSIQEMPKEFMQNPNFVRYAGLYSKIFQQNGDIPQMAISANITSSVVLKCIIRWLKKMPIVSAPKPIMVDPWE
jgi:molybdopterin/thiamine biosynthesis adenylyltransferase